MRELQLKIIWPLFFPDTVYSQNDDWLWLSGINVMTYASMSCEMSTARKSHQPPHLCLSLPSRGAHVRISFLDLTMLTVKTLSYFAVKTAWQPVFCHDASTSQTDRRHIRLQVVDFTMHCSVLLKREVDEIFAEFLSPMRTANQYRSVCTLLFHILMYLLMLLMLQDDTSTEDDAMTSDSHQHVSFAVNVSHNDSISDSNCREGIA